MIRGDEDSVWILPNHYLKSYFTIIILIITIQKIIAWCLALYLLVDGFININVIFVVGGVGCFRPCWARQFAGKLAFRPSKQINMYHQLNQPPLLDTHYRCKAKFLKLPKSCFHRNPPLFSPNEVQSTYENVKNMVNIEMGWNWDQQINITSCFYPHFYENVLSF